MLEAQANAEAEVLKAEANEKAIVANCAAARERDSNGTNSGYNPERGHTAGEFGHNDFYPVCIAAAQMLGPDAGGTGEYALRGMICLDVLGHVEVVFNAETMKRGVVTSAGRFDVATMR